MAEVATRSLHSPRRSVATGSVNAVAQWVRAGWWKWTEEAALLEGHVQPKGWSKNFQSKPVMDLGSTPSGERTAGSMVSHLKLDRHPTRVADRTVPASAGGRRLPCM